MRAAALLLCLMSFIPAGHGAEYLTVGEALKCAFPAGDTFIKTVYLFAEKDKAEIAVRSGIKKIAGIFSCYQAVKQGVSLGYAVVDNVIGKSRPITYMLAVSPSLEIISVEILAFRESHGWEIKYPGFKNQFKGKTGKDRLKLNEDIRNLSGATLSCRAVTDGVRLNLACLSVALKKNILKSEHYLRSQYLMGTLLAINLSGENNEPAAQEVFYEVKRLEHMLSTFIAGSEISTFNRSHENVPFKISGEALAIIDLSLGYNTITRGAFDITAGTLIKLWQECSAKNRLPLANELAAARAGSGMNSIVVDKNNSTVMKRNGKVSLDFGAIGKGYALDKSAEILAKHGIKSGILDFGGQILVIGSAGPQEVLIKDPLNPETYCSRIYLAKGSVSTSADYERGIVIQGRRYSHIVNPNTGYPAAGLLSVTVVSDSAAAADALSTALFAMGYEAAVEFIDTYSLTALLVAEHNRIYKSAGYRALEQKRDTL